VKLLAICLLFVVSSFGQQSTSDDKNSEVATRVVRLTVRFQNLFVFVTGFIFQPGLVMAPLLNQPIVSVTDSDHRKNLQIIFYDSVRQFAILQGDAKELGESLKPWVPQPISESPGSIVTVWAGSGWQNGILSSAGGDLVDLNTQNPSLLPGALVYDGNAFAGMILGQLGAPTSLSVPIPNSSQPRSLVFNFQNLYPSTARMISVTGIRKVLDDSKHSPIKPNGQPAKSVRRIQPVHY
jgi:hypothetical protein